MLLGFFFLLGFPKWSSTRGFVPSTLSIIYWRSILFFKYQWNKVVAQALEGSVWESVKNCSSVCKEAGTRSWISRVAHDCKPPDWCTRAKHARSWSVALAVHYRTKVLGWPSRLLAAWTRDSTQSRGQAARIPCLAKYDFSHSFSPYYIYTFIPTI